MSFLGSRWLERAKLRRKKEGPHHRCSLTVEDVVTSPASQMTSMCDVKCTTFKHCTQYILCMHILNICKGPYFFHKESSSANPAGNLCKFAADTLHSSTSWPLWNALGVWMKIGKARAILRQSFFILHHRPHPPLQPQSHGATHALAASFLDGA